MLEEAFVAPKDAEDLINTLEKEPNEAADIVKKVEDLLDGKYVIDLVKELEKEIRLMEIFWQAA